MTTEHKPIQTRAPKGSLGKLIPVAFRIPVIQFEKLSRIAIQRRLNKTAVIRCAIDEMEEGK